MRSLTMSFVLLFVFTAPGSLALAQSTEPASKSERPGVAATKEEVSQLRSEVAAQRQTIEELKALVEKLAEGQSRATGNGAIQIRPATDAASLEARVQPVDASGESGARLTNAVLVEPVQAAKPAAKDTGKDQKPAEKKSETPVVAGWNG